MTTTSASTSASTTTATPVAASLAADPFSSLAVHYGMLLGVPDFQVMMANPRGKLRLHQAWQHGPGVVWGYPVAAKADSAELEVGPGLAVDAVGREVALAVAHCVDVAQWLDEHAEAAGAVVDGDDRVFNAQLVLRHRACLARPVPAMSTACDGSGSDTAWSRVLETAELELRPYGNDAGGDPAPPADTRDDEGADLRALVRDLVVGPVPVEPGGWVEAFRAVAARVTAGLAPPAYAGGSPTSSRLFPADEPGELVLADLPGIRVTGAGAAARVATPVVDLSVRRSHLSTWLIEELLAELLAGWAPAGPAAGGGAVHVVAIERAGPRVTVTLSGEVVEGTVAGGIELRAFDASAAAPTWGPALDVSGSLDPVPADPGPPGFAFDLPSEPTADVSYRLVLRGTGPTPIVGIVGGRPVPLGGGRDVAETIT